MMMAVFDLLFELLQNSSIFHLVLILFVPSILSRLAKAYRWLVASPSEQKKAALSTRHYLALGVFAAAFSYQLYCYWQDPLNNIFDELELGLGAPNFLLRNRLREYQTIFPADSVEKTRLEFLGEKLRVKENRRLYGLYGERLFQQCNTVWTSLCQQALDYFWYFWVELSGAYLLATAGVMLGLDLLRLSVTTRWKKYLCLLLFMAYSVEAVTFLYFSYQTNIEIAAEDTSAHYFLYNYAKLVRTSAFLFLYALLILLSYAGYFRAEAVEEEIYLLGKSLNILKSVHQRQASLKLLRNALVRHGLLRDRWVGHLEQCQNARLEVYQDEEYHQLRESVKTRMGPENLRSLGENVAQDVWRVVEQALGGGDGVIERGVVEEED